LVDAGVNLAGITRILNLEDDNADLSAANTELSAANSDLRSKNRNSRSAAKNPRRSKPAKRFEPGAGRLNSRLNSD
jgi:hypothetical protein